jgi:GMP synthase-like glutamine amidotransferase
MNLIIDMNVMEDTLGFSEFVTPIKSIIGECEVVHYLKVGDVFAYDRIILSGTPLKDNEYMDHLDAFKWMKTYSQPVLGICAGMQVIAAVYGCKLERCQEIGMVEIETTKGNPIFNGKFKAYELHNYTIKPSKNIDILAMSKKCNQAIKHRKKPHYGVLFHPEIRNGDILHSFLKTIN